MTIEELFTSKSKKARKAALEQYAHAHDHFSEQEQILKLRGQEVEAVGAHAYALQTLRAYRAELDDPEPKVPA